MSAPPDNPNYGQTFTKGIKYIKIHKLDKEGINYDSQLGIADNIIINYPDIGGVQYDILTTQQQGDHYLMGVVPSEITSSFNEIKDFDLTVVKNPMSKTLNPFDVVVFNDDNDGGLIVVGGNNGGFYDDPTDVYTFNTPNIEVSVTSSINVSNFTGLGGTYFSLLVPSSSIDEFIEGFPLDQFQQLGIQVLNTITVNGNGPASAQSLLAPTSGGPCFFAGMYVAFGSNQITLVYAIEEINQSETATTVDSTVLININPSISNFEYSDYNAILGNTMIPQFSQIYQDVDYTSTGGFIPINFDLIVSGSAVRASVQDSNYSQAGWSNGRYNGSKVSSIDFNQ